MRIEQIDMDHPLYQQERELRNNVLLRPIGIPDYGWEKHDDTAWHLVAVEDEVVIGCVLLALLDASSGQAQLMQMAVDPNKQGQGLGTLLVKALLELADQKGLSEILIHSRSDTTGFYQKLGFQIYGEGFEEVGVAHQHMKMKLKHD